MPSLLRLSFVDASLCSLTKEVMVDDRLVTMQVFVFPGCFVDKAEELGSCGIQPVRNVSSRWVLLSTVARTAAY